MKVLENTTAVLANTTFQDLKNRINGHDKGLDILDQNIQKHLTMTNDKLYKKAKTLNNHHLAIKMITKAFTACTKFLSKYTGFSNIYSRVFEDFL